MKFGDPPSDKERRKHGVYLKLGKFFRSLLGIDDNKIVQKLSASLKGALVIYQEGYFQFSGKPSSIYTLPYKSSGSLGSSCMRDCPESFFHIYDLIEGCGIRFKLENDLLVSRFLTWDRVNLLNLSDFSIKTIKFADRLYTTKDEDQEWARYKRFCEKNGYYYRSMGYDYEIFTPNGEYLDMRKFVLFINIRQLIDERFEYLPYVDTFQNVCWYNGRLVLSNRAPLDYFDHISTLNNTDGALVAPWFHVKHYYFCESELDNDNPYYDLEGNQICESCFHDNFFYCEGCNEQTDWDDGIIINDYPYCPDCVESMLNNNEIFQCEECGGYYRIEEKVIDPNNGDPLCEECAKQADIAFC